ncbi:YihY/virulence factor BrkB family protein [Actinoplanes sp. NPDC051411]|uniref:YihY/virulence factor BrkB family protein n=1 Tax=Actinoplanes sp. NPDC051411 TaxID=3155522 RepID=UPI00344621A3
MGWATRLRGQADRTRDRLYAIPGVRAGWRLLCRSGREYLDDHCAQMAAAISYHLMFSLFPLAIAGVGVLGLLTGERAARKAVIDTILQAVPLSAEGQQQLSAILASISGSAGAFGLLGLLGVLWSATGVMAAVRASMNVAWDVEDGRSFLRGKVVDLLLLAGCGMLLLAGLGVTLLTGFAQTHAHDLPDVLTPLTGPLVAVVATFLSLLLTVVTFLILMRFVPAKRARVREIWPAAVIGAVGFVALQYGFSFYLSHFSHYNRVYGSLGTVVAFMFFVYLAAAILLFAAEVGSEFPNLSATDEPAGCRKAES